MVIVNSCCNLLDRGVGRCLRGCWNGGQHIPAVLRIVSFHPENQASMCWAVPPTVMGQRDGAFSSNTPCFSNTKVEDFELNAALICLRSTVSVLLCGLRSTVGSSSNPATIPSTSSTSRVISLRTGKNESTTESIIPWAIQSAASKYQHNSDLATRYLPEDNLKVSSRCKSLFLTASV